MSADVDTPPKVTAKCDAKTRGGGHCRKEAGWGTDHLGHGQCRIHGGLLPMNSLHSQVVLARRDLVGWARAVPINPTDAILQCIYISAGMVQYATSQIAALSEAELVSPVVVTTERPYKLGGGAEIEFGEDDADEAIRLAPRAIETVTTSPQLHVWIRVRDEAMDRLVRYSKTAHDAKIDEQEIALKRGQAEIIATVLRNALVKLGVWDRPETPGIVRAELERAAASGQIVDGDVVG